MVYNEDFPSFRWDPNGLNAYKFDNAGVDTTQFVRFDQYGIYGMKNLPSGYDENKTWVPTNETDIYNNADFGLTWSKFFMKNSSGDKSIEISTEKDIIVKSGDINRIAIGRVDGAESDNYGIRIRNNDGDIIFNCDDDGANIAGWQLGVKKDINEQELYKYLKSDNIELRSNGNIGCYAHDAYEIKEQVYLAQVQEGGLSVKKADSKNNNTIVIFKTELHCFFTVLGHSFLFQQFDHLTHGLILMIVHHCLNSV